MRKIIKNKTALLIVAGVIALVSLIVMSNVGYMLPKKSVANNDTTHIKRVTLNYAFIGTSQDKDAKIAPYHISGMLDGKITTYFVAKNGLPKAGNTMTVYVNPTISKRYASGTKKSLIAFYDKTRGETQRQRNYRLRSKPIMQIASTGLLIVLCNSIVQLSSMLYHRLRG